MLVSLFHHAHRNKISIVSGSNKICNSYEYIKGNNQARMSDSKLTLLPTTSLQKRDFTVDDHPLIHLFIQLNSVRSTEHGRANRGLTTVTTANRRRSGVSAAALADC